MERRPSKSSAIRTPRSLPWGVSSLRRRGTERSTIRLPLLLLLLLCPYGLRYCSWRCRRWRRRGRWRALSSVQRYVKTHWLIRRRAELGPAVMAAAAAVYAQPVEAFTKAILASGRGHSPLGAALLKALAAPLFADYDEEGPAPLRTSALRGGDLAKRTRAELRQWLKQLRRPTTGSRARLSDTSWHRSERDR